MASSANPNSDLLKNNSVLFLDRDGVINEDKGFISKNSEFVFHFEIFDICKHFLDLNYRIVVITNQSGIGRGIIDIEDFHKLTFWMIEKFNQKGQMVIKFVSQHWSSNSSTDRSVAKWSVIVTFTVEV